MLQEVKDQSSSVLEGDKIRWVITVPAVWRQPAKQFMREAAYLVGTHVVLQQIGGSRQSNCKAPPNHVIIMYSNHFAHTTEFVVFVDLLLQTLDDIMTNFKLMMSSPEECFFLKQRDILKQETLN